MKTNLILVFALVAAACDPLEGQAQDDEISSLKAQIEAYKNSISKELSGVEEVRAKAAEIEGDARLARSFQKASDALRADSREGRLKSSDLENSLIRNQHLLQAYRQSFQIKTTLEKGAGLDDFTTSQGVGVTGVVFNGTDNEGVHIIHSDGVAKLKVTDLPSEIAKLFEGPPLDDSTVDVAALLERKPDALKPRSEVYADAAAQKAEELERHKEERADRMKKNREIEAKITVLRAKVRELESNSRSQYTSRRSLEREQYENKVLGRTTKSQADMNQLLAEFDRKIAAIKAAIAKLESDISLLQSQTTY